MKKTIALLLIFVLTLAILLPTAFAEISASPSSQTSPGVSASPPTDNGEKPPEIKADSALLIDVSTGAALISQNPDEKIAPASTTKILTSLLVLEKESDLLKQVTLGNEIKDGIGSGSSKADFKVGETVKIEDLLYGLMVKSGNDAANGLAKAVGGSIDGFVTMMNEKAKALGMANSAFVNAHGIDKEGHYTTANDMKILTMEALKNPQWKKFFTAKKYDIPQTNKQAARTIETTDKLISSDPDTQKYHYDYAEGGKTGLTGYTNHWNGCLVALAKKDNRELLLLLFGDHSNDPDHRFVLAKQLFEWGFSQAAPIDLKETLSGFTIKAEVQNVADTEDSEVEFAPNLSKGFLYTGATENIIDKIKNNLQNLSQTHEFIKELKAPLKKGEVVGTITIKYQDEVLGSADLIVTKDVLAVGEGTASSVANSPSSPVQPQPTKELFPGGAISPWWWLLLPFILIIIIVLRVMTVNKRHRSRFKNKRKVYNYRIK